MDTLNTTNKNEIAQSRKKYVFLFFVFVTKKKKNLTGGKLLTSLGLQTNKNIIRGRLQKKENVHETHTYTHTHTLAKLMLPLSRDNRLLLKTRVYTGRWLLKSHVCMLVRVFHVRRCPWACRGIIWIHRLSIYISMPLDRPDFATQNV